MRVPRKVVFIIVLTDTVCTTQKACREMSILLQILTLGSSDYILIEQTHLFHHQAPTGIENVKFREVTVDLLPGTSSGK